MVSCNFVVSYWFWSLKVDNYLEVFLANDYFSLSATYANFFKLSINRFNSAISSFFLNTVSFSPELSLFAISTCKFNFSISLPKVTISFSFL